MSPLLVFSVITVYFGILILISYITSKNADTTTFFTGNKQSPWYLVAFGMIGASLSGVTFISVPGAVVNEGMAYFQVVLGYVLGYLVIAKVLMPIYYKLNLISIYEYLNSRFGIVSYKTGASFFILSRTLGSSLRLFLATIVLQLFLFEDLGFPYWLTAVATILLIWVYTFKGGIKTIVYTDTFQTFFLISAVVICTIIIAQSLDVSFFGLIRKVNEANNGSFSFGKIFFMDDYKSTLYFPKQFFGGMFIAIAMTGLDQDLMQKNLTCKNIKEAQRNMYSFTAIMVVVTFLFLLLGGALYVYAQSKNIALPMGVDGKIITDKVFPTLAFSEFGTIAGIFFLLGIIASSYASADSALAALSTGFCIDFLNFNNKKEQVRKKLKNFVHIGFSALFLIIILIVNEVQTASLISTILKVASYTYGPLLGLFGFGIITKYKVIDKYVPVIAVISPILCYILNIYSVEWFNGYEFGFELLIVNGLITFLGLYILALVNGRKRLEKLI
ncbi:MAG: sodium:solute symporter [Bacteroidetes bacterium GWA2_30_7]|nr:MAG: sodium:solute symporter [Bacteroidetes bacterium GWA2_30_7]